MVSFYGFNRYIQVSDLAFPKQITIYVQFSQSLAHINQFQITKGVEIGNKIGKV
jgi:hypothetical protein